MPTPVVLDNFGGLVSVARPEDLPEGASPRNWDVDFLTGTVIQRPGLQNIYSYEGLSSGPRAPGTAVSLATVGNPWANPNNVKVADSQYATASVNGPLSIVAVQVAYTTIVPSIVKHYYLLVTFASTVPLFNGSQQYLFSGLTSYTALNGQTLTPISSLGTVSPSSHQAMFSLGLSATVYTNTPDTGTATVTPSSYTTDSLQLTSFGFAIPSGASITGIQLSVKGYMSTAFSSGQVYAQLLQSGVPVGSVYSGALPLSNNNIALGSLTDTWGSTWNTAQVNNTTFGVRVWCQIAPYSSVPTSFYLDYCGLTVAYALANANYTGIVSAKLNGLDQTTLALDGNGEVWAEDVTNNPGVLSPASAIPPVPAGSYMKGVDADGAAFLAFSDLTQGTAQPMQYNGQWCDRITQVGPGAPPQFTASTQSSAQASVTAYSYAAGILSLTSVNTFTAGELISFSGFTGACVPLNGRTFSVLGTGLSGSGFQIATALVAGAGADTGLATPQFAYPIVASPDGIKQPAQMSDPSDAGHFEALLWSTGPGSRNSGNTVTVYYSNQHAHANPDQVLVDAFNAGYPLYVYISNAPFGNGVRQVTSIGSAVPPGGDAIRWYFTYNVPTSNYQFYGGHPPSGYYQITQATVTLTTPVPGLTAGSKVSLAGVTASAWDGVYDIVQSPKSGSYAISQTQVSAGVATYTWALQSGVAPAVGQLVTVTNTLNAGGLLNVTDALVASVTGTVSGTFTVSGFDNTLSAGVAVEAGQATTAGTQFVIDPGAALVGTVQNPILGNSGDGTLTVVGAALGSTFPIGAGTRQGVVFFVTRNGAVTRPSPPAVFTVTTGCNYITASGIPIGPENVIARGIAFTEAGQDGVPGGNFYTYNVPVTFTVGGVKYVASALIVPDNSTTTAKFTFSDAVLLSSEAIDVQGNNYFNLIELGDPAWMYQYADRMMYGLCRSKLQNLLNMSFDGGYLSPGDASLPMPLGWKAATAGNRATYTVTSYSILSNVATFVVTNNLQPGIQVTLGGFTTGTYFNGVTATVTSASAGQFTIAFTHGNVLSTADAGTASVLTSSVGLETSPIFGQAFTAINYGTSAWTTPLLFQGAYQDAYSVPILNPNTAYSVRMTARALNADNQQVSVTLNEYSNATFGPALATATFTLDQGSMVEFSLPLTTGLASIPSDLQILVNGVALAVNAGIEIDRIEVFQTDTPVDTGILWTSYAGNFEAVDQVTGALHVDGDNPQAAQGAFTILEQLYIEKANSLCVTQDSPNYEPDAWTVHIASTGSGALGPNAFDSGEEWTLTAARSGVYFFGGGKRVPVSRELQSSGVNGSVWEAINWSAAKSIWLRNDLLNRRFYIGVPMITPNAWLPNAAASTPTSPNVVLMCNYTGCPTAEELEMAAPVHTTMFGDLKALDQRRKWSPWQIACPIAEKVLRADGETQEMLFGNGIASSKIYQLVNGAPSGGQNTDDGVPILWDYCTYGFVGAKQGQQNPMLGARRKLWTYLTARLQGVGQVAGMLYSNTLGATYPFTIPLPFTLDSPAQNDQERVIEIGGNRVFVELSATGSGGYCELQSMSLEGEADKWSPVRGVAQ